MGSVISYLNGTFMPNDAVNISPFDRGYLYGDGVYEVIPAYSGKFYRLDEHLQRLKKSLDALYIDSDKLLSNLSDKMSDLLYKNEGGDKAIYLQITRGFNPVRELNFSDEDQPTVFATVMALPNYSESNLSQGIVVMTAEDQRCPNSYIKSINKMGNILMRHQAKLNNLDDTIIIKGDKVLEATQSNIFLVQAGTLVTPKLNNFLLAGITRAVILDIAKRLQIPTVEREVIKSELYAADEIFLTSSSWTLKPVVQVDKKPIGSGFAGPMWKQLYQSYCEEFE